MVEKVIKTRHRKNYQTIQEAIIGIIYFILVYSMKSYLFYLYMNELLFFIKSEH